MVEIYIAGVADHEANTGAWCACFHYEGKSRIDCGFSENTTINRMQLIPAIHGLRTLRRPCNVTVYSEALYLHDGITKWFERWKANNWKTSAGKTLKNLDLWLALDEARSRHACRWVWIPENMHNKKMREAKRVAMGVLMGDVKPNAHFDDPEPFSEWNNFAVGVSNDPHRVGIVQLSLI